MTKLQILNLENAISKIENDLMGRKVKLAKLRKKLPREPVANYLFHAANKKIVRLSDLFNRKSELILVHNMGKSCPFCAMWADGFNGILKHLESRTSFAIESPDIPAVAS